MIYAVNKRTKTHRIVKDARDRNMLHEVIVKANDDGWIEWNGGECPLPSGHPVECLLRGHDNSYTINTKWASTQRWNPKSYYSDVIAYRPTLNTEETEMKQQWSGEGLPPVGTVCELSGDCGFYSLQLDQITELEEGEHVVVIGHAVRRDNGCTCITIQSMNDLSIGFSTGNSEWMVRPIKTDRDRWIEAAMGAASCPDRAPLVRNYFESIYDAGLAKLPEQEK